MKRHVLHEKSTLLAIRLAHGPEFAEGFDFGLFRPPLRASLE